MVLASRTFGWKTIGLLNRDCSLESAPVHFRSALNDSDVLSKVSEPGLDDTVEPLAQYQCSGKS
jgi:hypothetical protein